MKAPRILSLAALLIVLYSCEKQPYIEHPHEHYDSAVFVVGLGADQYIIKVECWGTGLWAYNDSTFKIPAYDITDPGNGRMIFYRRFTVRAFIDCQWEYAGWNIVQDTNFVDKSHLNPEEIELDDCL